MNPKDPNGAIKAKAVGYSVGGKFISLFEILTKATEQYGISKTRKKRTSRKKKDGQGA